MFSGRLASFLAGAVALGSAVSYWQWRRLEADWAALSEKMSEFHGEQSTLSDDVKKLRSDHSVLSRSAAGLAASQSSLSGAVRELRAELFSLARDLKETAAGRTTQKRDVGELRSDYARLSCQLEGLSSLSRHLQEALAEQRAFREEMKRNYESMARRISALESLAKQYLEPKGK